jgi:protein O-mannosyl-transferase
MQKTIMKLLFTELKLTKFFLPANKEIQYKGPIFFSRPFPPKALLILSILIIIPLFQFFPLTGFGFVSFDDTMHVYQNPHMERISINSILGFWQNPYGNLYIPVSYTVWSILSIFAKNGLAMIGETSFNPAVFHWANLFLHLLNTLFVFFILRKIVSKAWPSVAGALVFSLHPVMVESVAWISELRGLLSAFFGFGSILLLSGYWQKEGKGITYASPPKGRTGTIIIVSATMLFLCALLSKPSAVIIPLIFALLVVSTKRKMQRPHFSIILCWLVMAISIIWITRLIQPAPHALPFWQRLPIVLDSMGFYIVTIIFPGSLCVDYGRTPFMVIHHLFWPPMSLVSVCAALIFIFYKKKPPHATLALLIFCVALIPVSGIAPFDFQEFSTVADRYLYVPMLGLALLITGMLAQGPRVIPVVVFGTWLCLLITLGSSQINTWRNSKTLYSHALEVNPKSYRIFNNFGRIFAEERDYNKAFFLYKRGLMINPEFSKIYFNLSTLSENIGNRTQALQYCVKAAELTPESYEIQQKLGNILEQTGNDSMAMDQFRQAMNLGHEPYSVCIDIGLLYSKKNQHDSAVAYLLKAVSKRAYPWAAYNDLGLEYWKMREKDKALGYFSQAVACYPDGIVPLINRGKLYVECDSLVLATRDFMRVKKIDPHNEPANTGLVEISRLDKVHVAGTKGRK